MKIWQLTGVAIAVLLLGSCGLLTDPTVEGSWQWFTVGTKRSDFGGFRFAQNGALLYFSFAEGNARFNELLNDWVSVETPGGYGAVYDVARDGTEFATSYGIYTRPSTTAAWTLIPGSRALRLQYVALDRDENLYATVDSSVRPPPPVGSSLIYVKLKGSNAWTPVSGLPTTPTASSGGIDPIGRVYVSTNTSLSFQLQGASATPLPQPQAMNYDYAGNRYTSGSAGIQKVTPSGTLETWLDFAGKQPQTISKFLWFGKDGRVYAIAGVSSTIGSNIRDGDIIAISPNDSKWSKVASILLDGAGRRTGPGFAEDYNIKFAPDGSLYVYGCSGGCSGGYGIYRLKF